MKAKALNAKNPADPLTLTRTFSLHGFRLFEGIPVESVDRFGAIIKWRHYDEGEMVFDQESDGLDVHFVMQGRIRLLTAVDGGEPITLAEVAPGEIFGELAAIDRLPRSARAIVSCGAVVGSIDGAVFVSLLELIPRVAIRVLNRLAGIIRSMDVRLANTAGLSPTQRVIVELMRRAEPDPRVPGMWLMAFTPSHAEIAVWSGLDRGQVAQIIGALARQALLRRRGGTLILVDWAALQAMVRPATRRPGHDDALESAFVAEMPARG